MSQEGTWIRVLRGVAIAAAAGKPLTGPPQPGLYRRMKKPLRRRVVLAVALSALAVPLPYFLIEPFAAWTHFSLTHGREPREVQQRVWGPPCSLVVFDSADPRGRGTCNGTCEDGTAPSCVALAGSRLQPGARVDGLCDCDP